MGGKKSFNSSALWRLTMTRWKEKLLSEHQHGDILYWESPTPTPLSVGLPSSPPHCLSAVQFGSAGEGVDGQAASALWDLHENVTEPIPCKPSSVTIPVLHQCCSHAAINAKNRAACLIWPLEGGSPCDNTQQLSKVKGREMWQWNGVAEMYSHTLRKGLTLTGLVVFGVALQLGGWPSVAYRVPNCGVPLIPTFPLAVVLPLHSSVHTFAHAPQSQLEMLVLTLILKPVSREMKIHRIGWCSVWNLQTQSKHHVGAVKTSTDVKQFSCVHQTVCATKS